MSDKPEQTGRGWPTAVGVIIALAGLYVCGYFTLCERTTTAYRTGTEHGRYFKSKEFAHAYRPLAWIEEMLRRESVRCGVTEFDGRSKAWIIVH